MNGKDENTDTIAAVYFLAYDGNSFILAVVSHSNVLMAMRLALTIPRPS